MSAGVATAGRKLVGGNPKDINHGNPPYEDEAKRVRFDLHRVSEQICCTLRLGSYPRRSHRASAEAHCPLAISHFGQSVIRPAYGAPAKCLQPARMPAAFVIAARVCAAVPPAGWPGGW